MLDQLIRSYRGRPQEEFLIQLRQEIGEDQDVLNGIRISLRRGVGVVRNTTAFAEKLTRIKLLIEDPSGGQLARLEKLEALWHSLLAVSEDMPVLRSVDLAKLEKCAENQRNRVEAQG